MKNFMNFELGALNVVTTSVETGIVDEFQPLASEELDENRFAVVRPAWNSDLQWISASSPDSFTIFQSAFDRLGIAAIVSPYLDLDEQPRLYSGFLVVRGHCSKADFHVDWVDTGNEAFTFMTPISGNSADFGLLYRKVTGALGEYDYRRGEGILFGDDFHHSTKPGRSEPPVALLCFTFGSDKMEHWGKIVRTAGYQSRLVQRPDGQFEARGGKDWRTV